MHLIPILHKLTKGLSHQHVASYRTIRKKVMQIRADSSDDPDRDGLARELEDAADRQAEQVEVALLLGESETDGEIEESELLGISGRISNRDTPGRNTVHAGAFASA